MACHIENFSNSLFNTTASLCQLTGRIQRAQFCNTLNLKENFVIYITYTPSFEHFLYSYFLNWCLIWLNYMHLEMRTDMHSIAKEPSEAYQLIWRSNPEPTLCARVPNNSPEFWHMEKSLPSMVQSTSLRKSAKVTLIGTYSNVYNH